MKSLVIVRGLVKRDKTKWVDSERLRNFFIDLDEIKRKFATPEVGYDGSEVLGNSFSTEVYHVFLCLLCSKLRKGGMVVVDTGQDLGNIVETLAIIFGYRVFYKIFPIPSDYTTKPGKYIQPGQKYPSKVYLRETVEKFLDFDETGKNIITDYPDLLEWWDLYGGFDIELKKADRVLHISDLHSNWSLLEKVDLSGYDYVVFHGDYIDGPETGGSRKLMDYVITKSASDQRYIFIEGNHELRLRRYLGYKYFTEKHKTYLADLLYTDIGDDFIRNTESEFNDIYGSRILRYLEDMNTSMTSFVALMRPGETGICTHAGLRSVDVLQPKYIGSVIYGGRDVIKNDKDFSKTYRSRGIYSVHAHCKYPDKWNPSRYKGVYNIDPEDETKIVLLENKTWKLWQLEK